MREEAGVAIDGGRVVPDCVVSDEGHVAVGERHDNDHGFDFVLGEEIVEDDVSLIDGGPGGGGLAPAVEKIENGVGFFGFGVVAGWRVDDVVVLVGGQADDGVCGVGVAMEGAVRDGGDVPGHGGDGGDFNLGSLVVEVGCDTEVPGVEVLAAVNVNAVGVDLRGKRRGGDGPDAGGILRHGNGLGEAVDIENYVFCVGVLVAKGDGAIGVDAMRVEWHLGVQRECEKRREKRSRKGETHEESVTGRQGR